MSCPSSMPARRRAFLSYRHGSKDSLQERIIRRVVERLSGRHDVFSDKEILPGERWGERIVEEIAACDVFVPLIDADAMASEMVVDEVERAYQRNKKSGRPRIVPVRVQNREDFPYPLSAYLKFFQWFDWNGETDTDALLRKLEAVLGGGLEGDWDGVGNGSAEVDGPPAPIAPLEVPSGAIHPDSKYYVQRESDEIALGTLASPSVTVNVKGSRQMGKTSLLARLKKAARERGRKVVSIDFQLFDEETLKRAEDFYPSFCLAITDDLGLADTFDRHRHKLRTLPQTCRRYMEQVVLPGAEAKVMLVMDEVDKVFAAPFRNDFFGMLRAWHNLRSDSEQWMKLELVLCGSTEPSHFISADSTQSPFNVGERIVLQDFTEAEVGDLAGRHGLGRDGVREELYGLLHGHPFLTRRALYLLAAGRTDLDTLRRQATADDGPFGDHLRYYLTKLHEFKLVEPFREVLSNGTCGDPREFDRLKGFGLVAGEERKARARNALYGSYFGGRLRG